MTSLVREWWTRLRRELTYAGGTFDNPATVEAPVLWRRYADHVARLVSGAPRLMVARGDSWYAVLTRELFPDVNQCVLAPGAGAADAERVLALIHEADVPAVVLVSSEADETVTGPLTRAGLRPEKLTEPLMWCETTPSASASGFAVERVRGKDDFRRAIRIWAAGHAMDEDLVARLLGGTASRDDVSTWLARDGDEPISFVWLTHGDEVGVWAMMTVPAQRRRGAGRAVLTTALAELWQPATTRGAFLVSTIAGRPLYESVGFRPVDESRTWVTPMQDTTSLALEQPG
jgi:hypothetical protein